MSSWAVRFILAGVFGANSSIDFVQASGESAAMDEVEFQTKVSGNKGVIKVEGDLDNEQTGEALRKAFNDLFNRGQRTIVLDLSSVEIINSYGIGKILMCYKRLKAEEGTMMVKPLTGFVKEAFELLMLDNLFPVDDEAGE